MKRQDGFVSLFTCIMISLLLMVVTLSMVTLETLQLRKAEDAEQSLRAYYAAEAGVEDAVSKVLSGVIAQGTDQTCATVGSSKTGYDVPGAAGWTCQQISFSGNPTGKLETADAAKTIDPGTPSSNYNSVKIEWDQSSSPLPNAYNARPVAAALPAAGAWTYAAPPVELSIVEYPRGNFSSSSANLKLGNVLFLPGGAGAALPVIYNAGLAGIGVQFGSCAVGNPVYRCSAVVSNLANTNTDNYIFRIRSRYNPTAYRLTFYTGPNANGNIVSVPDGTATIDVTARAGQTYRRVISKLPLNNGAAEGLNYVMFSDTDICKNFIVFSETAQPGCPAFP